MVAGWPNADTPWSHHLPGSPFTVPSGAQLRQVIPLNQGCRAIALVLSEPGALRHIRVTGMTSGALLYERTAPPRGSVHSFPVVPNVDALLDFSVTAGDGELTLYVSQLFDYPVPLSSE